MGVFAHLDWTRIDVCAIVTFGGLATIDERRHAACQAWLLRHGYTIDTFDCRPGLSVAIPQLGHLLDWEAQFGYTLAPDSRNLDALRDGFTFDIPEGGGRVLEVLGADVGWQEDARWLSGFLAIAQEHCREHLALGQRFFVLLVVPERSPFIGAVITQTTVPGPFWSPCDDINEFVR